MKQKYALIKDHHIFKGFYYILRYEQLILYIRDKNSAVSATSIKVKITS